jgi:hypothetical protein
MKLQLLLVSALMALASGCATTTTATATSEPEHTTMSGGLPRTNGLHTFLTMCPISTTTRQRNSKYVCWIN